MNPTGSRLLLVEDHQDIRKLIKASLKSMSIPIDEAGTSDAARLLFNANPGAYAMTIIDIRLPGGTGGTGGLELCREIAARRAATGDRWPYVIVVSARTQQSDRQNAIDSGAHLFMPKPFSPRELLAMVKGSWAMSP